MKEPEIGLYLDQTFRSAANGNHAAFVVELKDNLEDLIANFLAEYHKRRHTAEWKNFRAWAAVHGARLRITFDGDEPK